METISLKMEETLLKDIDSNIKKHRYSTRTEFIRDAIRKQLTILDQENLIKELLKFKGKAKKKTTNEENKKTAEKVLLEMAKERDWEIK